MPLGSPDIGPQDVTRHQRAHGNRQRSSALGLGVCIALSTGLECANAQAKPKPPRIEANGGLVFQSQGGGTPNTFSGYLFAPLSQGSLGEVLFLDVVANLNLGGALVQQSNVNAGASTRLGYRWLSRDQRWMYGVNAGVDTRQAYTQYAFQAGVGAEALNRNVELRANGYIPFSNQADKYATGWTNAYLINNQLILDGWNRYVVSLGGVNLEAGLPVARWNKDSLWLYGSYYYLGGNYVSGTSGVRGRAEVRVGSQLSVGATLSYDNIFQLQATGYLRYGAKPLSGKPKDAVDAAERNFLALRGLPMQRETDIRMVSALQNLPGSVATNPGNGGAAWVVKCTRGNTTSNYSVNCGYGSLDALLAAAATNDVLLVGGNSILDISTVPIIPGGIVQLDARNRPTIRLAVGTQLGGSGGAPTLATQFGSANLTTIFGTTPTGQAQSTFSNGVISIGSNTTIAGFNFSNVSITNHSTSNVLISGNTFTGSYTDPIYSTTLAAAQAFGAINVSEDALPAIQLSGVSNLTISDNVFLYPQVQTYRSQEGRREENGNYQEQYSVCNQNNLNGNGTVAGDGNTSGLCLSANAIRLNNSSNVVISGNSVDGALDEAFRINNTSGTLLIDRNDIANMRMGPDSNIGTAIIVGQNQGTSTITISNNNFRDNSPGVYPVVTSDNQTGLPAVSLATPTRNRKNNIDPIEIGLCRGTTSYPRVQDLYADASFSGNCDSGTTMNITVSGNTISLPVIPNGPGGVAIAQDGDGIDFNLGNNAILNATISANTVRTLNGTGDNGITFDVRGTVQGNINILNNSVDNVSSEAIDLEFANSANANQPGSASIYLSGNTFGSNTLGLLAVSLTKNDGSPVSSFYLNGSGRNADTIQTINPTYNNYISGNYSSLYLNGSLYVRP
jgi:Inverse autotransporter, beta-domain